MKRSTKIKIKFFLTLLLIILGYIFRKNILNITIGNKNIVQHGTENIITGNNSSIEIDKGIQNIYIGQEKENIIKNKKIIKVKIRNLLEDTSEYLNTILPSYYEETEKIAQEFSNSGRIISGAHLQKQKEKEEEFEININKKIKEMERQVEILLISINSDIKKFHNEKWLTEEYNIYIQAKNKVADCIQILRDKKNEIKNRFNKYLR